jgi:hypothetical protein
VGRDNTSRVLVLMPFVEKDLFRELCDGGSMLQCEPEERLSVGLQIVKGCLYLKEMGLEGMDLRPNNIRVNISHVILVSRILPRDCLAQ